MKEADFNIIEAAIRGQLGPSELEAFDNRLSTDPEFKKDYEDVRLMINAAKSVAFEQMTREIGNSEKNGKTIAWPSYRAMAIAATLLLIAISGIWLYTNRATNLFEQNYSSYETLSFNQPRGDLALYETKLRALGAYQKHEIAKAIVVSDSALSIDPNDEETLLLAGLCYLEQKNFKQALAFFDKIENTSFNAVQWYSALAYLGIDDKEKAKSALTRIIHSNSPEFSDKASALIKKLESN